MLGNSLRALSCALMAVVSVACAAGASAKASNHSENMKQYISGGKRITVETFEPARAGKFPAIVVVHGSNGPVSSFIGDYAQQLADQGYVLAFVHYFDRTGTRPYPSVALMERDFPNWVETVRDAITYVEANPKVEKGNVALLGISLGGFLSTTVSSFDPRVKAVVDVCGGIPEPVAAKTAHRLPPTLILHGDADPIVPVTQAYALEALLKRTGTPYEMEIYPGQGHLFRGMAQLDAVTRALSFLEEHLGAQTAVAR